jgi:hypothetical protein
MREGALRRRVRRATSKRRTKQRGQGPTRPMHGITRAYCSAAQGASSGVPRPARLGSCLIKGAAATPRAAAPVGFRPAGRSGAFPCDRWKRGTVPYSHRPCSAVRPPAHRSRSPRRGAAARASQPAMAPRSPGAPRACGALRPSAAAPRRRRQSPRASGARCGGGRAWLPRAAAQTAQVVNRGVEGYGPLSGTPSFQRFSSWGGGFAIRQQRSDPADDACRTHVSANLSRIRGWPAVS